jgi:hypothetical protein
MPLWWFAAWLALAGSPEPQPDGKEPIPAADVLVVSVGETEAGLKEQAERAIASHLSGLDAQTDLLVGLSGEASTRQWIEWATDAAREHDADGVFWIELPPEGDVLIFLVEPTGGRALVRRVERPESDAATVETIALVVRGLASALISGQEIGMRPVEPVPVPEPEPEPVPEPAPPPPQPPPPTTEPLRRLAVALDYRGSSFGTELPWQNALGLRFSGRPLQRFVLGLDYHFFIPRLVPGDPASFTVQRNPIALFAALRIGHAPVQADFGFDVGVDLTVRRTTFADELSPEPAAVLPQGFAAPWARLRVGGWRGVWLFVGVGAEIPFNHFDFVVRAPQREVLLTPHPVRARATAGVEWSFLARP